MTPLQKYWVRETYWVDDEHLEPNNAAHRVAMYMAGDVSERMKAIRDIDQEPLRAAIQGGDTLRMLEHALRLLNACRDIAADTLEPPC